MNRQIAKEIIITIYKNIRPQSAIQSLKKNKDLVEFANSLTPKLENHSLCEKCYWIINDLYDFPKCKMCNCDLENSFGGINIGYRPYCSRKCASNSEESKLSFEKTMIERYGVSNPSYSKELMDKARSTMINRYGVEYACQSNYFLEKSKLVYLEHYGVDHPMKSDIVKKKIIDTCIKKYGVTSVFFVAEIIEKIKNTCLERYGTLNPIETEEVKRKIKDTIIEHFGSWEKYVENFNSKYKNTCLKKYGVEHFSKTEEFLRKYESTCLERYGVKNTFGCKEIRQKIAGIMLEKYNVINPLDNPIILEKANATKIQKYGCVNPSHNQQIRKKIRITSNSEESKLKRIATNRKRFGYDYPQQNPDFEYKFCMYRYNNLWFHSTWEILFYDFLENNDIFFVYQPRHYFNYEYDNKIHQYKPDFYLPDFKKFIELKGDHFFDKNGKMINPFDRTQDLAYEAKHQCMLKNKVSILRSTDLINIGIDLNKSAEIDQLYRWRKKNV